MHAVGRSAETGRGVDGLRPLPRRREPARALHQDVELVDGVWVVRGWVLADIDSWLSDFESALPAAADVPACLQVIKEYVHFRDRHEAGQAEAASRSTAKDRQRSP